MPFAKDLKQTAKQRGRERSLTLEFWFRKKFNLAPTDPRFLAITEEDLIIEFWSWHYHANPHQEEAEDQDFDLEAVKAEMADPSKWQDT